MGKSEGKRVLSGMSRTSGCDAADDGYAHIRHGACPGQQLPVRMGMRGRGGRALPTGALSIRARVEASRAFDTAYVIRGAPPATH